MDVKNIIVARQAEPMGREYSISGFANYLLADELPVITELSVIISVLAYPNEYGRDYVLKFVVVDEDGKELESFEKSYKFRPTDRPIQYNDVLVIFPITFETSGIHDFIAYIDGEFKSSLPLELILRPKGFTTNE